MAKGKKKLSIEIAGSGDQAADSIEELLETRLRDQPRTVVTQDGPNPLACGTCGAVGNWKVDPEDENRVLCAVDETHVFTKRPDIAHPTVEGSYRIDVANPPADT